MLLRLYLLLVITRGGGKTFNNSRLRAGEMWRVGQYFCASSKFAERFRFNESSVRKRTRRAVLGAVATWWLGFVGAMYWRATLRLSTVSRLKFSGLAYFCFSFFSNLSGLSAGLILTF